MVCLTAARSFYPVSTSCGKCVCKTKRAFVSKEALENLHSKEVLQTLKRTLVLLHRVITSHRTEWEFNFFSPWLVKEKHRVSWWEFTEKVNRFFPLNVDYFCVIKVSEWIRDNCGWVEEAGAGRLCRRYTVLKEVWVVSYRVMGCFIKWMGLNSKSSNWLHRFVDSFFCSHFQFSDTLSLFQGLHTCKSVLTPNTSAAVFCLEALPLMGFWFPPPSVHREDIVQEEIKKTPTVKVQKTYQSILFVESFVSSIQDQPSTPYDNPIQ